MAKNRGALHKPHVYVRETPEGPKYTIVMRGIPGGEHPLPVGTSELEVDALVDRYKGKRRKPNGRIQATTRLYTVRDGWANFEEWFKKQIALGEFSQATWDELYEPGWRLHIDPLPFARKAMNDVAPDDITNLSADLRLKVNPRGKWIVNEETGKKERQKFGNSLASRCETILRSTFRQARLAKMTENDPFKDLKTGAGGLAPKDEPLNPPRRPLTASEQRKLIANLTDMYWDECQMLGTHPVRVSELLGVRPCDIDLTGLGPDTIDLPIQIEDGDEEVMPGTPAIYYRVQARRAGPGQKRTKNKLAIRPLPLSPGQIEIIARRWEVEEFKRGGKLDPKAAFFTRPNGDTIPRSAIYQAVEDAAKRAGLEHASPKDLRMSIATAFTRAGVPEKVAAGAEGHTTAVRDRHYDRSHLMLDATVEAFEAIRANGFDVDPTELIRRGIRKEES